jgi:tetratricopeptide (TPR) repeat protein
MSLAANCSGQGLAAPTNPLPEASWLQCADPDVSTNIGACSTVIQSGAESGARLAIAYYNRANAYRALSLRERSSQGPGEQPAEDSRDLAFADYDRAIRLKPDFAAALVNRGIAYYEKGQFEQAIQDYDRAIALKPDLAEAFNNRCLAYLKLHRYDRALTDFDQTIRLNKNYGNALINRALGPLDPLAFAAPSP